MAGAAVETYYMVIVAAGALNDQDAVDFLITLIIISYSMGAVSSNPFGSG